MRHLLLLASLALSCPAVAQSPESRPWARWWWLGSAVDTNNLTRLLTQYRDAGFGGVEICPIYGAKGAEDRFVDFLSPQWMALLAHTTREGKRLGLGIDLTTGTGWPFGGPWVTEDDASSRLVLTRGTVEPGKPARRLFKEGTPLGLFDLAGDGTARPVPFRAAEAEWQPKEKALALAAARKTAIQKVKRAAPGGAGRVLDPYNPEAMRRYLARFDEAFRDFDAPLPRAMFHDSFEYFGADFTPALFTEFEKRRGYDLRTFLGDLTADAPDAERAAEVRLDLRLTLGELHQETMAVWAQWARGRGVRVRNQSHGAPANLLDLYAAVDIPETEIFRHVDAAQIPMLKLASSGAHLTGRPLVSAESFTWLKEHFQTTLADLKPAADFLFLSGVNHLVYHGIPYSPEDAGWPGWLFYASVHCGPHGGLWRDLPTFNESVTRCQTLLQAGRPDTEALLYFPIQEIFRDPKPGVKLLTVHAQHEWLGSTDAFRAALRLQELGVQWDWVSDALLESARAEDGRVVLGDVHARAILVAQTPSMPASTRRKLHALAEAGVTVVFTGNLPAARPGRRDAPRALTNTDEPVSTAWKTAPDAAALPSVAGFTPHPLAQAGLSFVRRTGPRYFVVNSTNTTVTAFLPAAPALTRIDPLGLRPLGRLPAGPQGQTLQLEPGESALLDATVATESVWRPDPRFAAPPLEGEWRVEFLEGGPALPQTYRTRTPGPWTGRGDTAADNFSGTARYTLEFSPAAGAHRVLDLGPGVHGSARVRLNGRDAGTLFCAPWRLPVDRFLVPGVNRLEIEVTSTAANRIADLDRRQVSWKNFHEINFVNIDYKPFDASAWPVAPAGLSVNPTLSPGLP